MNRAGLFVISVCALLAGCSGGILDSQGPVSRAQGLIMLNSVAIMLCIVIPVIVGTIAVAWWFRASNERAHHRPEWEYSGRIELVTWAIPLMVILLLGGITYIGSHKLDPYNPLESDTEPLKVQVVSLDWKWLFIYPQQQVASVNRLVIPAGVPIHFHITSGSVMTAFFIPQLGSMIYAMNGMQTQLHLLADNPGEYRGIASHYSGDGFSGMNFLTAAVTPAEFDAWARESKEEELVLDRESYEKLSEQDNDVDTRVYGKVSDGLFEKILSQRIAPADGPPVSIVPHTGTQAENQ